LFDLIWFALQLLCEAFVIHKCTQVFVWSTSWIYSTGFFKNTQISNLTKICPVGAKLFRVHRQTDRHNTASSCFSQFSNAPNELYFELTALKHTQNPIYDMLQITWYF
jgi:hypothetical protein